MYVKKGKKGTICKSDFIYEGVRYRKSWGRVNISVAKELERKWINEIASGAYQKKQELVAFEDFAVKYLKDKKLSCKAKGYECYLTSLKPLTRFFVGKKLNVKGDSIKFQKIDGAKVRIKYLSDINPFMIQQFKHERKKDTIKGTGVTVSNCTVNKSIFCLRNTFSVAKKLKMVKENPAEEIEFLKEKPKEVVILTREKEVEFFKAVSDNKKADHMVAIVSLAINTGMRKREILDLEKNQVFLNEGYLKLTDTKNGDDRMVPLTDDLIEILARTIESTPKHNSYVFPNPKTGKPYKDPRKSFTTAMKKIGLEGYRFHLNRHTFCSRMQEVGIDAPTIMEIGGWKDDSMVKRYSHPSIEHKHRALEKIQSKVPAKTTAPLKIASAVNENKPVSA